MGKWAVALVFSALYGGCAFEADSTGAIRGPESLGDVAEDAERAAGGTGGAGGVGGIGGAGGIGGVGGMGGVSSAGGVNIGLASCTPGTERSACPGTSCDPATLRCSTFKLASRPACWTCVSDSDCESPDHRCVEMYFEGERFPDEKHGFCLQIALVEGAPVEVETDDGRYELDDLDESNCAPPYRTVLAKRPSLSGGPTNSYCGLREDLTSCFALRAYESLEECPNGTDAECPAGGVCRTFGDGPKAVNCCTVECDKNNQCPSIDGQPTYCADYCGGGSGGG